MTIIVFYPHYTIFSLPFWHIILGLRGCFFVYPAWLN